MFAEPQQKNNAQQQSPVTIQPKLEIGAKDDAHEKEADAIAGKVMRMSEKKPGTDDSNNKAAQPDFIPGPKANVPSLHLKKEEVEKVHMKTEDAPAIKAHIPNGNGVQLKSNPQTIRRNADPNSGGPMAAPAHVESGIAQSKGGGESLSASVQDDIGEKMGADLSDVKIHTDSNAHNMSGDINAKAFTHGSDIYFKQGNYNPTSDNGKELLIHELVHTQQQKDHVQRKIQRVPEAFVKDPVSGGFVRPSMMKQIREALTDEWWSIDDVAAQLTDSEMGALTYNVIEKFDERQKLIQLMLKETFWSDEDDLTVIRAIRTAPSAQKSKLAYFLLSKTSSGKTYYSEIKDGISDSNKKQFYVAAASIGYVDNNKIPDLKKLSDKKDSDVDTMTAMLQENEFRSLSTDLRLSLIEQIGITDYVVDEEDSQSVVKLIKYVPDYLKVDNANPLTNKKQLDEQQKFKNKIHPKGSASIYSELLKYSDAPGDLIAAVENLYPDVAKSREAELNKDLKNPMSIVTHFSDLDDVAAMLTDTDVKNLRESLRVTLIRRLVQDTLVGDEDEKTLIRLVSLFSDNKDTAVSQKSYLRRELLKDDWALLKSLHSVVDGANYQTLKSILDDLMAEEEKGKMNSDVTKALNNDQSNTEDLAAFLGPKQVKQMDVQVRFDLMQKIADGWWTGGGDEEMILMILGTFVVDEQERRRYYELSDLSSQRELSISENIELEQLEEGVGKDEKERREVMELFNNDADAKDNLEGAIEGDNDTKFKRLYATVDIGGRGKRLRNADDLWFPSFSRDSVVATLSEEDLKKLGPKDRVQYIRDIAGGGWIPSVVGDEDENSLALLIKTIPNGVDARYVFDSLEKNNGELYKILDDAIHGEEYKQFHEAIAIAFGTWKKDLADKDPNEKQKQADQKQEMLDQGLNHPKVFPWQDPGLLKSTYTGSYEYDVSWVDGKIMVSFYYKAGKIVRFVMGSWLMDGSTVERGPLDPFELIGVKYLMNESETGGREGEIDFMPAINLFQLATKQYRHHKMDVLNLAMLLIPIGQVAQGIKFGMEGFLVVMDLVLNSVVLVIDSYQDEIASLPGGLDFLNYTNAFFIGAGVVGGLYALTRPEVWTQLNKLWNSTKEFASVAAKEAMEVNFFKPIELSQEMIAKAEKLKTQSDLELYRKYLKQLEADGKILKQARQEAEIAAAKKVEAETTQNTPGLIVHSVTIPASLVGKLSEEGAAVLERWISTKSIIFEGLTGANAQAKIFEELESAIGNKSVLETIEDSQHRLSVVTTRPGKSNIVVTIHPTNVAGEFKITQFEPAYNPELNPDIDVPLSANKLVPDYSETRYLHPSNRAYIKAHNGAGIKIEMQGTRGKDFTEAYRKLGIPKNGDYTWHHMDDFEIIDGKPYCTMQLVESVGHGGPNITGMQHSGSVAQFKSYYNINVYP